MWPQTIIEPPPCFKDWYSSFSAFLLISSVDTDEDQNCKSSSSRQSSSCVILHSSAFSPCSSLRMAFGGHPSTETICHETFAISLRFCVRSFLDVSKEKLGKIFVKPGERFLKTTLKINIKPDYLKSHKKRSKGWLKSFCTALNIEVQLMEVQVMEWLLLTLITDWTLKPLHKDRVCSCVTTFWCLVSNSLSHF